VWFRLFAVFGVVTSLALWQVARSGRLSDAPHPERGAWLPWVVGAISVGLWFCQKWAAVLVTIICGAVGAWLTIGTFQSVPWPWSLVNLWFGLMLWLPAAVTRRYWQSLR